MKNFKTTPIDGVTYDIKYTETLTENTGEFNVEINNSDNFDFMATDYHLSVATITIESGKISELNAKIANQVLTNSKNQ